MDNVLALGNPQRVSDVTGRGRNTDSSFRWWDGYPVQQVLAKTRPRR